MIEEIQKATPKKIEKYLPFIIGGVVLGVVALFKRSSGNTTTPVDKSTQSNTDNYKGLIQEVEAQNKSNIESLKNSYDEKVTKLSQQLTQSDTENATQIANVYVALSDTTKEMTQQSKNNESSFNMISNSLSKLTDKISDMDDTQTTLKSSIYDTFSNINDRFSSISNTIEDVKAKAENPKIVETIKYVEQPKAVEPVKTESKKSSSNKVTVTTTTGKTRELDAVKDGYKTQPSKSGGYYYAGIYFDN